jgi:NAD(P)-dependent dehydrogenase (short-subunit alcohol dehydrogenase family)
MGRDHRYQSYRADVLYAPEPGTHAAQKVRLHREQASISGVRPTSGAAYTSSKAALVALTQNVAFRCVDEGIRANSICPSRVATEMVANVVKEAQDTGAAIMHHFTDRYIYRECRPITVEGIASVALFLASDLLSGDVTGQTITVDGGSYMPCR